MSEGFITQLQHATFGAWQKVVEAQVSRTLSFYGRLAQVEEATTGHAQTAIDEWARLSKEAFAYQVDLAGEWRKLSLDTLSKIGALGATASKGS
jgi:hypothetical protein